METNFKIKINEKTQYFELKGGLEKKNQIDKRIQNKKIKFKRMRTIFKKITNHDYGFKDEIENKLKFNNRAKNKYQKLKNKDHS